MQIVPIFDRVVVKPEEVKEKKVGGVYLPTVETEVPMTAKVVAIGDGTLADGKKVDMKVAVGDRVLCAKFAGSEIEVDGEKLIVVRQADILAIIK